jgi:FtsP/CotA-like multicopper oxidase with cupredoxin domain
MFRLIVAHVFSIVLVALSPQGSLGIGVVELAPPGTDFDELPFASSLNAGSQELDISVEVGVLVARNANGSVLMRVEAPLYRNLNSEGDVMAPFGPTLRVERGGWYSVNLKNNLEPQPGGNVTTQANAGITNFHVHGLHVSTGVPDLSMASENKGGDNIFLAIMPGESTKMRSTIPTDHLPGVHWYHPHHHLGTTIQTFGAHGAIIIDDDDAWLPDANGCAAVKGVLNAAERKVMLFAKYAFKAGSNSTDVAQAWGSNPNYQLVAEQANVTYCCDEPGENDANVPVAEQLGTLSGTAVDGNTGSNLVFVNGGLQPSLSMTPGVWQRWSMVMATYDGVLLMQVLDSTTKEPACEIMKISSDGVFAMEIPRPAEYMLVPSGGRGEVLIRCNDAGTYEVVSTSVDTPVGPGIQSPGNIVEQTLVTLNVGDGGKDGPSDALVAKECTPLRPYYAADMRDTALKRAGVIPKVDSFPDFTGTPPGIGCSMSNEAFSMTQTPYELPIGQVLEWHFARLAAHPLHVHINPFQLVGLPEGQNRAENATNAGGWFEAGDFFDTLLLPQLAFNATDPRRVPVRFNSGPYAGSAVTHCHFLNHEDAGCMRLIEYTCPNGTVQDTYPYRCSTAAALKGTFVGGPGSSDPEDPARSCDSISVEGDCLSRSCRWNPDQSTCAETGPENGAIAQGLSALVAAFLMLVL